MQTDKERLEEIKGKCLTYYSLEHEMRKEIKALMKFYGLEYENDRIPYIYAGPFLFTFCIEPTSCIANRILFHWNISCFNGGFNPRGQTPAITVSGKCVDTPREAILQLLEQRQKMFQDVLQKCVGA